MNKKLYVFVLSLFFLGCDNEVNDNDISANKLNSTPKKELSQFEVFYEQFRNAVLDSNYAAVAKLSSLPIEVSGYDDNDPIRKVSKGDFNKIFSFFINEPMAVYYQDSLMSHLQYIGKFDTLPAVLLPADTNDYNRIENMEFKKSNGNWSLSGLYMNTRKGELWKK